MASKDVLTCPISTVVHEPNQWQTHAPVLFYFLCLAIYIGLEIRSTRLEIQLMKTRWLALFVECKLFFWVKWQRTRIHGIREYSDIIRHAALVVSFLVVSWYTEPPDYGAYAVLICMSMGSIYCTTLPFARTRRLMSVLRNCIKLKDADAVQRALSLPLGAVAAIRGCAEFATVDDDAAVESLSPASILLLRREYDMATAILSMPRHRRDEYASYLASCTAEFHRLVPIVVSAGYEMPNAVEVPRGLLPFHVLSNEHCIRDAVALARKLTCQELFGVIAVGGIRGMICEYLYFVRAADAVGTGAAGAGAAANVARG